MVSFVRITIVLPRSPLKAVLRLELRLARRAFY